MKRFSFKWLPAVVATIVALGMFPSLTALSTGIAQKLPFLAPYMGPLNPVKLFAPVLFLFIWLNRQRIERRTIGILLGSLAVGSISTLLGGWICYFPAALLREWAVMVIGVSGSIALLLLPQRYFRATLIAWGVIVFGSAFLNLVSPDWLSVVNTHFFDPQRVVPATDGLPILIGFYDTASLGKLLVWLPWILFWGWEVTEARISQKRSASFILLLALGSVLTLMTTQRGPFIGMIGGWFAFLAHQAIRLKQRNLLWFSAASLVVGLAAVPFVVPREIIETRIKPLITTQWSAKELASDQSRASVDQRRRLLGLTLNTIAESPLGKSCLPASEFTKAGILEAYHSHSLILEQFRTRGWLWGVFHLGLWIYALVFVWRGKGIASSAMVGGVATTLVLGLVDHPWFVINHAMILGVLLFGAQLRRPAKGLDA